MKCCSIAVMARKRGGVGRVNELMRAGGGLVQAKKENRLASSQRVPAEVRRWMTSGAERCGVRYRERAREAREGWAKRRGRRVREQEPKWE